jgi:hypothetical protein
VYFGTANASHVDEAIPIAEKNSMRSELAFHAVAYVSNRFLLTMLAAKATGKLHRANNRIQETTNKVLVRFSHANTVVSACPMRKMSATVLRKTAEPNPATRVTRDSEHAAILANRPPK